MISDIERGAKSPTVVTVVRLAEALGVTAASLIDGGTATASRIRILRRGEGEPYRYEREVEEFLRWSPHVRTSRTSTGATLSRDQLAELRRLLLDLEGEEKERGTGPSPARGLAEEPSPWET